MVAEKLMSVGFLKDYLRDPIAELMAHEPQWGPIGKEVYERTYSRPDANGKGETWRETVRRVVRGNISLVDSRFIEPQEEEALVSLLYNFQAIPAGRHLWVSGVPGRAFLFNCHRAGFTGRFSRHFEFTFNELMKGGGVGANYSNEYIAQYPAPKRKVNVQCYVNPRYDSDDLKILSGRHLVVLNPDGLPKWPPAPSKWLMSVQDSREGWFEALNAVLDAYMLEEFFGEVITLDFDLSLLRPKGTIIKGFGGIASGPWALATLLQQVSEFLNTKIGSKLTSMDFMYIDHLIASCVVAGNVRRSARMAIKHWKDPDILDFIACKTDTDKHWSTNISIEVDDDFWGLINSDINYSTSHFQYKDYVRAMKVFHAAVEGMMLNGEPGFVNTSLASIGERGDIRSTNPCGEIFLEEWENCNLGHINLGVFWNDRAGAREAFRLMQRYLIRATFGDITDPAQRDVVDRNRRTGVGIFGYQAWVNKQSIKFSDSWREETEIPTQLKEFKKVCDETALQYANELGIPCPIKRTTVAPTGTIAKLPGTSEGIQTIYARYGIRRVLYGEDDPKLQGLFANGYKVEDCVYAANTKVVEFPYKDIIVQQVEELGLDAEHLVEDASEVDIKDFLAVQAMVQEMYVDNSISLTINFRPGQYAPEEVRAALSEFGPRLKGTTLMPDGSRPQSPYERITREQYEATGVGVVSQGEMECSTGACPVK